MRIKQVHAGTVFAALVLLPFLFTLSALISDYFRYVCILAAGLVGYWLLGGRPLRLFRPMRQEDLWTVVFCTFAAAIIGMILALSGTFMLQVPMSESAMIQGPLNGLSALGNLFTVLGEEMMAVVILTVCEHYLPKKKSSLLWAALLSCLIFGAYHIGAYGWGVWIFTLLSCLVRLPFTYAWYKSDRNLLVNGLAHWGYNMLLFALAGHVLIYS